jgi:proline dehydrogenase
MSSKIKRFFKSLVGRNETQNPNLTAAEADKLIEAMMLESQAQNKRLSVEQLRYLLSTMFADYSAVIFECFNRRDEFDEASLDVVFRCYIGIMRFTHALNEGTEHEQDAADYMKQAEDLILHLRSQAKGVNPMYFSYDTVHHE